MQESLSRFAELNAQVLGISVDSVFSHRAFAKELGGLDFPLLSDFFPHGEVTRQYGLWDAKWGSGKRAVIIIDAEGIVRSAELVPIGTPDIEKMLEAIRNIG